MYVTMHLEDCIAGLAQYPNVWNKYFISIHTMNLGIGSDCHIQECTLASHHFTPTIIHTKCRCSVRD